LNLMRKSEIPIWSVSKPLVLVLPVVTFGSLNVKIFLKTGAVIPILISLYFLLPYVNNAVPIQVKLLEGEPRDVLPKYVSSNEIDLVILGSMSRAGISGFVMGNTAESMINQLGCSVITLKPDSFKSPVSQ